MHAKTTGPLADLGEVQRQIQLWTSEAAELCPSVMALASTLGADASRIVFNGDLIVLNLPNGRNSNVGLLAVDLAAIRRIVCNLKILQAQRRKLEARKQIVSFPRKAHCAVEDSTETKTQRSV